MLKDTPPDIWDSRIAVASARRRRFYVATNGVFTVWRPARSGRMYHSVDIQGARVRWRCARPSGPESFPCFVMSVEQLDDLLDAKAKALPHAHEPWLLNEDLPWSLRTLLRGAAPDQTFESAVSGLIAQEMV
jgi:hypothetical protein